MCTARNLGKAPDQIANPRTAPTREHCKLRSGMKEATALGLWPPPEYETTSTWNLCTPLWRSHDKIRLDSTKPTQLVDRLIFDNNQEMKPEADSICCTHELHAGVNRCFTCSFVDHYSQLTTGGQGVFQGIEVPNCLGHSLFCRAMANTVIATRQKAPIQSICIWDTAVIKNVKRIQVHPY